jgi:hypothetical protein
LVGLLVVLLVYLLVTFRLLVGVAVMEVVVELVDY